MLKNPLLFSPRRKIDRRLFLKTLGLAGMAFTAHPVLAGPLSPVKFSKESYLIRRTKPLMGTFVTITLLDPSREKMEEGMGEAFDEMERLTAVMNRFIDTSFVSELNRTGMLKETFPELTEVLNASRYYYSLTHGAFEITDKPVLDIYADSQNRGKSPDSGKLHEALRLIGTENILFGSKEIRFKNDGMGITLDGIAKGYIVDKGVEHLKKKGLKHALINAGGDIRAIGGKGEKTPWTVAIRDPFKERGYKTTIPLLNRAVATSGNYEIFFDRDRVFHHIVDPAKGLSPNQSASASIISENAMAADALATSVFVKGPDKGARFISSIAKTEALIIDSANSVTKTSGWKEIL